MAQQNHVMWANKSMATTKHKFVFEFATTKQKKPTRLKLKHTTIARTKIVFTPLRWVRNTIYHLL